MPKPKNNPNWRPDFSAMTLTYTIGGAILLLTLGGMWLDKYLGLSGVFVLVGAGLGLAYALYEVWLLINRK